MELGLPEPGDSPSASLLGNWGSTTHNNLFSLGEAFVVGSKELVREQEGKLRTPRKTRKLRFRPSFQNPGISAWNK